MVDAPRFTAEDEDPDAAADQQTRLGVELAHDSLISRWERLHQLALRDRDCRIWQDGLRRRIDTWYGEGCPKRRLLSLSDAREARRWLRTHPDEIGSQERRYLARSSRRHRGLGLRAAGCGLRPWSPYSPSRARSSGATSRRSSPLPRPTPSPRAPRSSPRAMHTAKPSRRCERTVRPPRRRPAQRYGTATPACSPPTWCCPTPPPPSREPTWCAAEV
ncbi:hypothetical protein [Streptomyces sp. NPDC057686]|uniref:nSTAND1 domain-containing NTPase n=1 Tax=Streptomyces sp. NPDC057686 TaxID=3346212 RepID=UPI0036CC2172